jgi:glyoxylase-like metal-dependent hydrolase (beta-lactamase superfamily II)
MEQNMTTISRRRFFETGAIAAAAAATLSVAPHLATAKSPKVGKQVNGLYRRQLGDFEITALSDGYLDIGHELWTGIERAALERSVSEAFQPANGKIRIGITSYVINTGNNLVLVDTGSANYFGPTAGRFADSLAAAGIKTEDVDTILITHMHPDHTGAMNTGIQATFPKAVVHICGTDQRFWTDDAAASKAPDAVKPWYKAAQDLTQAYKGRLNLFSGGPEIMPGITAMPLVGHTPGHTGYRVTSGRETLLIWGDMCGIAPVQFQHPDAGLVFDIDGDAGRATRRRTFDMAAADRLLVTGAHLPFPSFGYVARRGDAYAWVPDVWQF